jgi:hypothetical protein
LCTHKASAFIAAKEQQAELAQTQKHSSRQTVLQLLLLHWLPHWHSCAQVSRAAALRGAA